MPGARVGRADTSRCRSERDVARGDADYRLGLLARRLDDPPEAVRAPAETLLARRDALMERISDLTPTRLQSVKTRCHGNLHLGHILVVENDLVDVAGMVPSFDQVARAPLELMCRDHPAERERLNGPLARWSSAITQRFLAAYAQAASGPRPTRNRRSRRRT